MDIWEARRGAERLHGLGRTVLEWAVLESALLGAEIFFFFISYCCCFQDFSLGSSMRLIKNTFFEKKKKKTKSSF